MKYLLVVCLAILISGCSGNTFFELGAGWNESFSSETYEWENADSPAFYGAIRQEWDITEKTAGLCQYAHHSQWFAGPPFNDDSESSLDHLGCALRFRLR